MRIVIFGGAGFLGKKLARELLKLGQIAPNGQSLGDITSLVLFDRVAASGLPKDDRLQIIEGSICNQEDVEPWLEAPTAVIFHLAAIVSGEAEKDFDLGMQVNFHATLQMLELCRKTSVNPVFVFASSCAVFGGKLSETIHDNTAPSPQSSYGTQKAMIDLLVNDYSRRGFIDGRALRLPTIAIRPGKPNAATSSFVSSIIREPLMGKRANCPVAPDTKVWILSPRKVTENFIHAAGLPAHTFGKSRVINLPGITTTVAEMVKELEKLAGMETIELIDWLPDTFIQSIVLTWPPQFEAKRALKLGFQADKSVNEIIKLFKDEELR